MRMISHENISVAVEQFSKRKYHFDLELFSSIFKMNTRAMLLFRQSRRRSEHTADDATKKRNPITKERERERAEAMDE